MYIKYILKIYLQCESEFKYTRFVAIILWLIKLSTLAFYIYLNSHTKMWKKKSLSLVLKRKTIMLISDAKPWVQSLQASSCLFSLPGKNNIHTILIVLIKAIIWMTMHKHKIHC